MQKTVTVRSLPLGVLARPRSVAATLALGLVLLAGCSGGSSTPGSIAGPTFSNLALDKLGAAVALGRMEHIEVTALSGDLEPLVAVSSDPNVASASTVSSGTAATVTVTGLDLGTATVTVTGDSGDSRQFPVTVYDPHVLDMGDMLIKLVDDFELRWNDRNTGSNTDGAVWHPVAPPGYHALGSFGMNNYGDPNGRAWAIVVKDKGTNTQNPPIVEPMRYDPTFSVPFWSTGFPPELTTFWRPVPPNDDYVAVGTVATRGSNPSVPVGAEGVVCVRKDLTEFGEATLIWNDAGSGSSLPLMSLWQIGAKTDYNDYELMFVGAGSSIMRPQRGNPSTVPAESDLVRVLRVRPQVLVEAEYLWEPALTSTFDPEDDTQPILTRSILVPITAFYDFARAGAPNLNALIQDSPFFVLERRQYWNEEWFGNVGGQRGWETGLETNSTQTTWQQNSVEVSAQAGFEFKGFSGSISATVTETLGFASSTQVGTFTTSRTTVELRHPPPGSRIALWRKRNRFNVFQHGPRGLVPSADLDPWAFDENSFHTDTFPQR